MINSISGRISGLEPGYLYLETGGIEWELAVPAGAAFGQLGTETRAYTWLQHREDLMCLYGFPSPEDRALFLELIKVEGIGPKQAIKILSGLDAKELVEALEREDIARLESVPGIGRKTAQKMVLALQGRLPKAHGAAASPRARPLGKGADIVMALQDMGYDRRRAEALVSELVEGLDEAEIAKREPALLREAIIGLSG
jgi:Holliday junction DNA helicase RuvA